jgi:hypothetical protein
VFSFVRPSLARRLGTATAIGVCLIGLGAARAQPAGANKGQAGGAKGQAGGAKGQAGGGAATRPAAPQLLDLSVSVSPVPGSGATLNYRGTFSGAPLGHGTVTLATKLVGGNATFAYVLTTAKGTLRGSGTVTLSYAGSTVNYSGTAIMGKGTGAYRTMRATGLSISGSSVVTSQHTTLMLTGPFTS